MTVRHWYRSSFLSRPTRSSWDIAEESRQIRTDALLLTPKKNVEFVHTGTATNSPIWRSRKPSRWQPRGPRGMGSRSMASRALNDTVIIAIDFEGINTIKSGFTQKEGNSQVGLAILDTKDLRKVPPEKLISTLNFAVGSSSYVTKASNKFIFGESITIQPSSMVQAIQSHIPQDRNVVLVGHAIENDLQALQALGFEFERPPSGILDTSGIANEVFGFWAGSLGELLGVLGCPFNRLHVAGNDANFTLKALLLLAAKWCIGHDQDDEVLDVLHDISTCPIRPYVDPEIEAAEKREKRLARSRKHQSKLWSKEKQDQIRAAREMRRLEHALALKSLEEAGITMAIQPEHGFSTHSLDNNDARPNPHRPSSLDASRNTPG
ncbi:hypothetical protein QBC40DRAFT_344426 [Triangularia verruculosa]|uniref:Gfd2/YDR514C-like C-terminal domain-containing protein n=1 Tax=Triangularia verruculosa TaxID=2587418 RepID=A0AAN7B0D3_9PEZI|nr:hypothetical protein QBC40DRAFT_344426 [Triangularia verruculosa]